MEPKEVMNLVLLVICAAVAITMIVLAIHVIKRLRYLQSENRTIEGELFVTDDGEMYSEFGIDYDEIKQRDTLLLKVHHIKSKEEQTNGKSV